MGFCVDVPSSGQAIVRIAPMSDGNVVQTASVPLTSVTGSATSNGVLITQRPIVILSAEVSFNTKPDAGTLDVGTGNTTPNEVVSGFNLTTLTNHAHGTDAGGDVGGEGPADLGEGERGDGVGGRGRVADAAVSGAAVALDTGWKPVPHVASTGE